MYIVILSEMWDGEIGHWLEIRGGCSSEVLNALFIVVAIGGA